MRYQWVDSPFKHPFAFTPKTPITDVLSTTATYMPKLSPIPKFDSTTMTGPSRVIDKLDETWRSFGVKNRMEFFRAALGHYLKQLGAGDAAELFANATAA
jgi:hypothetical protein